MELIILSSQEKTAAKCVLSVIVRRQMFFMVYNLFTFYHKVGRIDNGAYAFISGYNRQLSAGEIDMQARVNPALRFPEWHPRQR